MTWAKHDDGAESNPRVLRLEEGTFMQAALGFGDPYLQRGAVWGYITQMASWSGRHFTDLHFPEFIVRRVCGPHAEWAIKAAQSAGLLSKKKVKSKSGDFGWQFIDNGDELINVLTKEQVEANRLRNGARKNATQVNVRLRDGDRCRYCMKIGRFPAKTGFFSLHYEHPDPNDPTRLVVACGECNQKKGKRTPEEWGHDLLPPPDEADLVYNKDTLDLFGRHGITDLAAARAAAIESIGTGLATELVPEPTQNEPEFRGVAETGSHGPGRLTDQDGQGQAGHPEGSGPVGSGQAAVVRPLRSVGDEPGPGGAA